MIEQKPSLDLGVIGNGTVSALVDGAGAIAFMCLPRFDGEPAGSYAPPHGQAANGNRRGGASRKPLREARRP